MSVMVVLWTTHFPSWLRITELSMMGCFESCAIFFSLSTTFSCSSMGFTSQGERIALLISLAVRVPEALRNPGRVFHADRKSFRPGGRQAKDSRPTERYLWRFPVTLAMDVLEAIKSRRSIRKYLEVPVEWEKVGVVLEAGRLAPSAGNCQEWNFIVVTDQALREQIAEMSAEGLWMATAPVHIVITANIESISRLYRIRGERLYAVQDCAIAASQMMLAAQDQGLGCCWVGAVDEHALARLLSIPDSIRPQVILTLGYPDERPEMPKRKILENLLFLNGYGNRIKDIGFVLLDYNLAGKAAELGKAAAGRLARKMKEKREASLSERLRSQKEQLRKKLLKK